VGFRFEVESNSNHPALARPSLVQIDLWLLFVCHWHGLVRWAWLSYPERLAQGRWRAYPRPVRPVQLLLKPFLDRSTASLVRSSPANGSTVRITGSCRLIRISHQPLQSTQATIDKVRQQYFYYLR
jgi:hypothetical protein